MKSKQPVHGVTKGLWIGLAVVGISTVIVACSMLQRPQMERQAVPQTAVGDNLPATHTLAPEVDPSGQVMIANTQSTEPLSLSEIDSHRTQIKKLADDYPARIEARQILLGQLIRRGPQDNILPELTALLDDVEANDGRDMARRVAFSEAGTWHVDKHFAAAALAYQYIVDAYPQSSFAVESHYHIGECQIEQGQYARAEETFQRLIEQHDDSAMAGWGWRKLALAQLLQGRFDECLATLDLMSAKFADGEFGEYARARKGYVLMVAGRKADAKKAYDSFLAACPASKYCRLVQQQIREFETEGLLAKARS